MVIRAVYVLIIILYFGQLVASPQCDKKNSKVGVGNIGIASDFPWLGILKVYLHEIGNTQIAVSGVVLIKDNYAVVNAHDVNKIPRDVFLRDNEVMFIVDDQPSTSGSTDRTINFKIYKQWFCKVKHIITHPEYGILSYNTISLLELDGENSKFLAPPVCWPSKNAYNLSDILYIIGYTDENSILEKSTRKAKCVNNSICEQFYNKAQLTGELLVPTIYRCALDTHATDNCVLDNGMAVASNASGHWVLLGLSIYGPGCALPARFINIMSHLPWIIKVTTKPETPKYRRQDYFGLTKIEDLTYTRTNAQARRWTLDNIYVAKEIYENYQEAWRLEILPNERINKFLYGHDPQDPTFEKWFETKYLSDAEKMQEKVSFPLSASINQSEQYAKFEVFPKSCSSYNTRVFTDVSIISLIESTGPTSGVYWVTVSDDTYRIITCVTVKMKTLEFGPGEATLHFNARLFPRFNKKQPSDTLKKVKLDQFLTKKDQNLERPSKIMFLEPSENETLKMSVDLMVKFTVSRRAELRVEVFGQREIIDKKIKEDDFPIFPKPPKRFRYNPFYHIHKFYDLKWTFDPMIYGYGRKPYIPLYPRFLREGGNKPHSKIDKLLWSMEETTTEKEIYNKDVTKTEKDSVESEEVKGDNTYADVEKVMDMDDEVKKTLMEKPEYIYYGLKNRSSERRFIKNVVISILLITFL